MPHAQRDIRLSRLRRWDLTAYGDPMRHRRCDNFFLDLQHLAAVVLEIHTTAHRIVRRAKLDHIHARHRADRLNIVHSALLLDHKRTYNITLSLGMLHLRQIRLETDEAAVWISELPAVLCRFRRYEVNALFYLLRVAAVSKEDRLHTGGNGLLRNIASVLEIDLHHQAHPMQLSCTRHILKVALGKRRVLADKLHIVIVARAAGRLDHNRPGTPDARGKRWLARLEEHPQMIGFVCHSLVLKSSAAAAFLQLSGAPDGSSPSAPASPVRWAGTFSDP